LREIKLLSITPNSEKHIENCGRTCYKSFDKIDDSSYARFIKSIIKSGHHSVLEHATATFRIKGVSRSLTHQLVRHRLCSFSQQSQRYCREDEFEYIIPTSIKDNKEAALRYKVAMERNAEDYKFLRDHGILKEDARFVLPNACASEIVVSANFRNWRQMIELRTEKHAQWEIKDMCNEILDILYKHAPIVFEDLKNETN